MSRQSDTIANDTNRLLTRGTSMAATKVFDLHCDTIDALAMRDATDFAAMVGTIEGDMASNTLQLAFDRMLGVGPWCQCYAVWVPDNLSLFSAEDPLSFYRIARDYFKQQMVANSQLVAQVRDAREIDDVLASGRVAAMLTVENGSPIGHDLGIVDELAEDGVKMLTLTWNGKNTIASGSDTSDGLSHFGREAVHALEDHKIVVDVSHLNDEGFWDLMKVVRRPIAASHSNLRALCSHSRNLTDDQFRAIMGTGGIVGLNYFRGFVSERYVKDGWVLHDDGEVTADELYAHIERFLDLGGENHISLGSDFDGSETPEWLSSAEQVAGFHTGVLGRFGSTITEKLFFENARAFFLRNETA